MENITLENGKVLNRLYGKYMPQLTLISNGELEEIPNEISFKKKCFSDFYGEEFTDDNQAERSSWSKFLGKEICSIQSGFDKKRYFNVITSEGEILECGEQRYDFVKRVAEKVSFEKHSAPSLYELGIEVFGIDFDGEVAITKGRYRKNDKGTSIFDMTQTGHILVKLEWGGAFNRTKGNIPKIKEALYTHRAASNGGGRGCSYIVVPEGWRYQN